MAAPKTMPPKAVRIARAREGGRARTTVEYHARKLVESWPELTAEQRDNIRSLLTTVENGGASDAA